MKQEGAVLDQELKHDTRDTIDPAVLRTAGSNHGASPSVKSNVEPVVAGSKRSFGERIKDFFSKFAKHMEGDHEYQNYSGR